MANIVLFIAFILLVKQSDAGGGYPFRSVPGVYTLRFGAANCPFHLRVDRTNSLQFSENNKKLKCTGTHSVLSLETWNRATGNELSIYLANNESNWHVRRRTRVGAFIIADLRADVRCTRANGSVAFAASHSASLNFFTPPRNALVNFAKVFNRPNPLAAAGKPAMLMGGARLLAFGDACMYARTANIDCFPAHATTQLRDGTRRRMDELQVGDKVLVAPGQFSPVFTWTHRDARAVLHGLRIATDEQALVTSPGHLIYINAKLTAAANARIGDMLTLGNGSLARISSVGIAVAKGLYNPHTIHGDIVVDEIRASTFTTIVDTAVAHALLTPLRSAHRASLASRVRQTELIGVLTRALATGVVVG